MEPVSATAIRFFLQMLIIIVVYRALHLGVLRRLGQVQVVSIMITGFLLGPSVFGAVAGSAQRWLFPVTATVGGTKVVHPSVTVLYVVGQLGLVCYMFLVGCSFDTAMFRSHIRRAIGTSSAGIAVPLVLGGLVGWLMLTQGGYFPGTVHAWQAELFLGSAIAISAFPMLAWIIVDSNLAGTRLGSIALACAAADDAVSWVLLACVTASIKGSPRTAVTAGLGGLLYLVVMSTVGRRLLAKLGELFERRTAAADGVAPAGPVVVVLAVMLAGAWFTDAVGVYSVFGAFTAGVFMPRGALTRVVRERMEPAAAYLLLPAFFVYSGLNTKLSLFVQPSSLLMMLLVIVVAFVAKGGAVGVTGRLQGMDGNEAGALASLMNARGLMELILLNIGLNAGIVSPRLYTILAVMAIVTTVVASPLYEVFHKRAVLHGVIDVLDEEKPVPDAVPVTTGEAPNLSAS